MRAAILLNGILLTACVNGEIPPVGDTNSVRQVRMGMTQDEVRKLLGEPNSMGTERTGNDTVDIWTYLYPSDIPHSATLALQLKFTPDGHVHEITRAQGAGKVRLAPPNQ
jgi:outer membrane protein assembly factor BamE (lipoprotein component of BamABCDE complex)